MQWPKLLNAPLSEVDPELEDIIEHEKNRQWKVPASPPEHSQSCTSHISPALVIKDVFGRFSVVREACWYCGGTIQQVALYRGGPRRTLLRVMHAKAVVPVCPHLELPESFACLMRRTVHNPGRAWS